MRRRLYYPLRKRFLPRARVRAGGAVMHVDLRDEGLTRELFLEGRYEEAFQRFAASIDLAGSVCVDVGANIGVHTLHLSRLAGPHGRVVALEPDRRNFELLATNIAANGASNVDAIEAAAGDAAGRGRLERSPVNFGDHRLRRADDGEAEIVVLDDVLRNTRDGEIGFVKIDVQGYETFVLRGLANTIRRNPEAIVLLELSPGLLREAGSSATELLALIAELGLSGWEIGARRISPIAPPWLYEQVVNDDEEHLVLCRNSTTLREVLDRFYGVALPAGGTS